ncbi:MAG TPA: SufE family protein [Devosia sp.]|nr:SufE family protein [Devosia sp.]
MSAPNSFEDISDNLTFLDDWEDRYKYLIELGGMLDPLPASQRTEANKVHGCVSNVWLVSRTVQGDGKVKMEFEGDSDAMIVKGLVAVLIAYYSGRDAQWIAETDAVEMFDRLGLREHLTSQRSNGLKAMVERIRREAAACQQD